MELLTISLRTVLIYFVVFFFLRIMGKREIGKLSLFDLVISIMIAEIAVLVIEDTKRPLMHGIVAMALLVAIQLTTAFFSLKSRRLRFWMDGRPSKIIENGKLNWKEMRKQKYNLDDLMFQLRENNVTNLADVEFATLETTGKLTVVQTKDFKGEKTRSSDYRYEGLPIPLIMDGKVQDENLEKIGKNRFWLKNELQRKGITEFKQVFICTFDHKGQLFIDKK